jgi:hypothetical protein
MVSLAILYTGELRTIEHCLPFFQQHVLRCKEPNEIRHVFAVLQNDGKKREDIGKTIVETMGSDLQSLRFYDGNQDPAYQERKNSLLQKMDIPSDWKDYLSRSGSMIEYYQMYLAFQDMCRYETATGTQYDYVIRIRCDCVIAQPLCLRWTRWDKSDIHARLLEIRAHLGCKHVLEWQLFMESLLCPGKLNVQTSKRQSIVSSLDVEHDEEDEEREERIHNYLKDGKYMLSYRVNIIYFAKRETFSLLHDLGITYGSYPKENDDYWFNAECQLQSKCVREKIDIFDCCTEMEGGSLYSYEKKNFFTDDGH